MKHLLITGSEGYIGAVMAPHFLERGYRVTGLDCGYFSEGNINDYAFPEYKLIRKDIREVGAEDLDGIDAVIHLAGLSNDPLGKLDESLTYDINYHASVKLAELAKKAGVGRFLFSSSCSLYGQGAQSQLTEESDQNPQTAYAKSKVLTEQALAALADESFSPVYLRNATAFGLSPRMRFDLVVNSLTGFAHTKGEIVILGDGKPWRPLVHIRDITKAFHLALEAPRDVIHNQAFNVGASNENYQIRTLAEIVKQHYPDCEIKIMQKDAGDTRDYNVSFGKIAEDLGYESEWSVSRGVEELADTFRRIGLTEADFAGRLYTRLSQIEYLIDTKQVDERLYVC